ncbi:baseplate J/gp47 family protein [Metapseudomonas otitidis]|uniref:baseplate J/gp47 family protein n=1 Tax=Metapseudomonas otitidis TaxID=319939 RepID=UPI0024496CB7|nr:baseplate J/gp47 family protein [Pseudomonas otitidis]MDG9784628.1 baseplate J/gp47 family protein [Pseudomonas otitidis]
MASPTAPTISATGISAPTYAEVLAYLQQQFRSIYGDDIYLESDSQDGQFLAVIAAAINDGNAATVAAYNAFSPLTAQGAGLSKNVKINGIARAVATNSSVDLVLVGQAGTTITNGQARDEADNLWALPASVTIPPAGEITVTATCTVVGDIDAAPGAISQIATPTRGWQSVTNPAAATAGAPVETDAALRARQATSVALPSRTVLEGTVGAVANLEGVTRYRAFENDTRTTDANGLPGNSIALVVEGGDAAAIAQAIAAKKTPGTGTFGTTSQVVTDLYGVSRVIRFYRPTEDTAHVKINLTALAGYNTSIGQAIQQAVADYINSLAIGGTIYLWRLAVPANLGGDSRSLTFDINSILIGLNAGTPAAADIVLPFNHVAMCDPADVELTVV